MEEVAGEVLTASTSHEAGRANSVREQNVPRGVGKAERKEVLEVCSNADICMTGSSCSSVQGVPENRAS